MNIKPKYHLVITSRDPATALSFNLVLTELMKHECIKVTVFMQDPANQLINKVQTTDHRFTYLVAGENNTPSLLDNLYQTQAIDAFLVGISGPDTGIDEAALLFCAKHHIKSYALQSFWGDFNQDCKVIPNTVFTLDSYASSLNNARFPQVKNTEIGSLKHANYHTINTAKLRAITRKKILAPENSSDIIIGFYGQPLAEVKGYIQTIKDLANALQEWSQSFQLIYRPHPKEKANLQQTTLKIFTDALGNKVSEDTESDINKSLSACDIVTSAFSTCCIDAVYLNLATKKAVNSSVFLWFNDELIQWWQEYSKMTSMPLTRAHEAIFSVNHKEDIIRVFEQALNEKQQARVRAEKAMPQANQAALTLIETIKNDLIKIK